MPKAAFSCGRDATFAKQKKNPTFFLNRVNIRVYGGGHAVVVRTTAVDNTIVMEYPGMYSRLQTLSILLPITGMSTAFVLGSNLRSDKLSGIYCSIAYKKHINICINIYIVVWHSSIATLKPVRLVMGVLRPIRLICVAFSVTYEKRHTWYKKKVAEILTSIPGYFLP